jgi:hypothetical protein
MLKINWAYSHLLLMSLYVLRDGCLKFNSKYFRLSHWITHDCYSRMTFVFIKSIFNNKNRNIVLGDNVKALNGYYMKKTKCLNRYFDDLVSQGYL